MKTLSVFKPLAEIAVIVLGIAFFMLLFAAVGCDRASNPVQMVSAMPEESTLRHAESSEEVVGDVVSVSRSYKVVSNSDVLYVCRIDPDGCLVVATIGYRGALSVALYETSLASVAHPVALLAVGVSDDYDGGGAAYIFSVSPSGARLEEEITPFRSSTLGFGSFVQFEHIDDAGWWLVIESIDGESYSAPIGRWF